MDDAEYKRALKFVYRPPGSVERVSAGKINLSNYTLSTQQYTPTSLGRRKLHVVTATRKVTVAQHSPHGSRNRGKCDGEDNDDDDDDDDDDDKSSGGLVRRPSGRNSWRSRWVDGLKYKDTSTRTAVCLPSPSRARGCVDLSSRVMAIEIALERITARVTHIELCACDHLDA